MSASHPTVAALLVTHNAAGWIEQTLQGIRTQRHQPDAIVIVDDQSTDDTRAIIERVLGDQAQILTSTSRVEDTTTRIAQNFLQGLRACTAYDIAVLGDHDDIWHPARIGHQANQLRLHPQAAMLASNGRLVNSHGKPTGTTLRDAFPVPEDFNDLPAHERMRIAIRQSVATGGASAVRPQVFADEAIPAGWLHDRWWSLVACARGAFRLDDDTVIDYRLTDTQEVGLDPGHQAQAPLARLQTAVTRAPQVLGKLRDLRSLADQATDPEIRSALSTRSLLSALA